jgi:hypothetical protein
VLMEVNLELLLSGRVGEGKQSNTEVNSMIIGSYLKSRSCLNIVWENTAWEDNGRGNEVCQARISTGIGGAERGNPWGYVAGMNWTLTSSSSYVVHAQHILWIRIGQTDHGKAGSLESIKVTTH